MTAYFYPITIRPFGCILNDPDLTVLGMKENFSEHVRDGLGESDRVGALEARHCVCADCTTLAGVHFLLLSAHWSREGSSTSIRYPWDPSRPAGSGSPAAHRRP